MLGGMRTRLTLRILDLLEAILSYNGASKVESYQCIVVIYL